VGAASGLESHDRLGSLVSGILLRQTYEGYLELHTPASISFEHAWFLLLSLSRREEPSIARRETCDGVQLRDLLAKRSSACLTCAPGTLQSG
jgi:hypothetical protein